MKTTRENATDDRKINPIQTVSNPSMASLTGNGGNLLKLWCIRVD
ncbi:MAG: hypothetical protein SWY16_04925 [Cyanobacteriota bacterium]|nr:hypothetical protein [Cyanobacteriota bacterium]